MLAYTEGDVKTKGVNSHYYRTGGDRPPFLLLHGATDNGLCWTPVAEVLAERYDVIMPDAQGHGLSDRLGPDFTNLDLAHQTVGLIRELGLTEPIIMGHSMGAGTAANIAIHYPDLPRAIILEDPPWITPESANDEAARKQHEAIREYLGGLQKLTLEEIIAGNRKTDPTWPEGERIPWASAKQQFDPTLFSRPIIHPSYEDLIPKIQCPTLLIIAESGLVTPATAEDAARLWKSQQPFRWVQIKGAGHNIRREQFRAFMDTLFSFLKELD